MFSHLDKFQLSVLTKNEFYNNNIDEESRDYFNSSSNKENIYIHKKNEVMSKVQAESKEEQEVHNLQDLWNNIDLQDEKNIQQSNQILLIPMEIHKDHHSIYQSIQQSVQPKNTQQNSPDNHQKSQIVPNQQNKPNLVQKKQTDICLIDLQNQEAQNLQDLWNQIQSDHSQSNKITINNNIKAQDDVLGQNTIEQNNHIQTKSLKQIIKEQNTKIVGTQKQPKTKLSIILLKNLNMIENSTNINLTKDFVIYDYQTYFMSFYHSSISSYFGFFQCPFKRHHYFLYDLVTEERILQCYMDEIKEIDKLDQKSKTNYLNQKCFRFSVIKTGQLIATAYYKPLSNGLIYNLKPFNHYQNKHSDTISLIQITDGYLANNCYCDTNVYVSQKYTNHPGQYKMAIGFKNGFLIANMGVNGVKSAPYNCRLQNDVNKSFSFLLGLIGKETSDFLIRIGDGMSPLLGMAISIGRKKYIDSFHE